MLGYPAVMASCEVSIDQYNWLLLNISTLLNKAGSTYLPMILAVMAGTRSAHLADSEKIQTEDRILADRELHQYGVLRCS